MARLLAEMQRQRDASSGAAKELQQWQRQAGYGAEEVAGLRLRLSALDDERASLEQALRNERQRSADLEAVTRQVREKPRTLFKSSFIDMEFSISSILCPSARLFPLTSYLVFF